MTSLESARLLLPLLLLLIVRHDTAGAACIDDFDGRWNNIPETTTESKVLGTAAQAKDVSLAGEGTDTKLDIAEYFEVSLKGSDIVLTPKPTLSGVRDYPVNQKTLGAGTVTVTCSDLSEEHKDVTVAVQDVNTATPMFSESSYSVDVDENYPLSLEIIGLDINAEDYDGDKNNYEVSFSLDDTSGTFSLTKAELTSTNPPTYSTQLMLAQTLDWSQQSQYKVTVTATDPGGLKSSSDVTIRVNDVDNKPPEFKYTGYTAEALDRKALGPLTVKPEKISATDPDTGGPLQYSLTDLPGASWAQYFTLDASSAALSLAKEIPNDVTTPSEISLVIEGKETKGALFASRAMLVVYLTPQKGEEPSTTGYIVGLAVLGCMVLILLVAVGVLYKRGKRPAQTSRAGNDWESGTAGQGNTAKPPTPQTQRNLSPEASPSRSAYDNPAYTPSAPTESKQRHDSPPTESSLYPPLHADRLAGGAPPSPPTSARPDAAAASSPPMSARPGGVGAASQPIGDEPAPPAEPKPDYAAKSVGFKDTVLCVTPVEAADVEEVEQDDESDEEADAEGGADDRVEGEKRDGGESDGGGDGDEAHDGEDNKL